MSYESEVVAVGTVRPNLWPMYLVLGILTTAIGIWLLFSPSAAVGTLAILLAIGLFLNGISELVFAGDRHSPMTGYVLGALFIISGIVVLVWPRGSLHALAVVFGIVLLATGLFQAVAAFMERAELRHWVFLFVLGVITFVAGFIAIVWPSATIYVLALILGIRVTFYGIMQLVIAWNLRKLAHS